MAIPLILHQIAPTQEIPVHLRGFQASWKRLNPQFAYHLWTDETLEAWIAAQAPEYLETFRAYPRSICRADLGRYLLLDRIGGVYADLDCQCLRPMMPLLVGRELVIAPEPEHHHQQRNILERGLARIVCPSFIASAPGQLLWREVFSALADVDPSRVESPDDVLDATGPFLLSRVFAANPDHDDHLIPASQIYPFTKTDCWQGRVFDPSFWMERTRHAYVAHYWDGSWFRPSEQWRASVPAQAPVHVKDPAWPVTLPGVVGRDTGSADRPPLISCLMVTRGRPRQAALAIDCFLAQTYADKELIVVDDDPHSQLAAVIAATESAQIRHVRLPDRGQTLGALRNVALENALGDYVCQWDDDDLHDPVRLEVQWRTLTSCGAQASVLARWMIWWPHLQRLALSCYRDWEGSLLCERSLMPRYPDWPRGEDSDLFARLEQTVRLVRIDLPRLCIYVCHGANTFESDHFERHWQQATAGWQGGESARLEQELDRRLPLLRYREALQQVSGAALSDQLHASAPVVPRDSRDPRVLILTPVRNGMPFLARYATLLERLDYEPSSVSLALMEGDSSDATMTCLEALQSRWKARFRRVNLYRHHGHPPATFGERWQPDLQRDRRERLAKIRNRLLIAALEDEDWVLWLDVDVCDYPADLLRQLLAAGRDIVTANCLTPSGQPFDLNSFRLQRDSAEAAVPCADAGRQVARPRREPLIDGLCQPPFGCGRDYVDAFRAQPLVELDAVGGTVLLVRADLHREGLNFPAYPVDGLIETEALSSVARRLGVRSWALPPLIVRHA